MRLFDRPPYRIRVAGDRVFVQWLKPIQEWQPAEGAGYLPELRAAVKATVKSDAWEIISRRDPSSDPAYREYVERIRGEFIQEFGLVERVGEVNVGTYHLGMLVLSFPATEGVEYPYYYRGVQLVPIRGCTTSA